MLVAVGSEGGFDNDDGLDIDGESSSSLLLGAERVRAPDRDGRLDSVLSICWPCGGGSNGVDCCCRTGVVECSGLNVGKLMVLVRCAVG